MTTEREIRTGLALVALKPCFLCGSLPANPVIWETSAEQGRLLGAPEGKERLIFYALCEDCAARDQVFEVVEASMISRAGARS